MLTLIAAFLATGCTDAPAQALAGSEWRPIALGDTQVPADRNMFVKFDVQGGIAGSAGCNRFFGSYREAGARINIGPLGTTRRRCAEALMDLEAKMLTSLERARSFERKRTELSLSDEQGKVLARFKYKDTRTQ